MFSKFLKLNFAAIIVPVLFIASCAAQQTEEQALQSLRQMTSSGKLPTENFVADLETRFRDRKTGALARLLRARIRFDAGDFAGAAAMLNTDIFSKRTKVADHAMWLRGRALSEARDYAAAAKVFEELLRLYPDFVNARAARIAWAQTDLAADQPRTSEILKDLLEKSDAEAYLVMARGAEGRGDRPNAVAYYRKALFGAPGSNIATEAAGKLTFFGEVTTPRNAEESLLQADQYLAQKNFTAAAKAYTDLAAAYPAALSPAVQLRRLTALSNSGRMADAQSVFVMLPASGREEGFRHLVLGYAKARQWPQLRSTVDAMRTAFPKGDLVAKTMIDAGLAAREGKNRTDEGYFLNTALISYPHAVEVAQAQFEAAWFQHEGRNFALSSQMLIDHLAKYADKDTTNRGKAGYWAARDAERAGKTAAACALYGGVAFRYGANWYGHLANDRLTAIKNRGECRPGASLDPAVNKAVENLKKITVAAETARERELERAAKSDDLSVIGLFDWAIDELNDAKKTAGNSPKINFALAKHYRLKGDQVNALLSLAKSYPDYAQMFPEEMGREEWDIFYPLSHWPEIKRWSQARGLDRYQVAGIIRQETIFDHDAESHANAYGLMQLLLPTAKSMARKYGASIIPTSKFELFQPSLNIELGTAYMKDQFDKFGRFEYVGIAYNAGPGRVGPWRAQLPAEMDEFVEAIPFKETKGYVQGIIRNSAQYRRLYDDDGAFKSNVGTRPLRGEIDSRTIAAFKAEFPEVVVQESADQ